MKNPLKNINSNLLVALSAVLISVCALVVSIYEVRIMRSEQRLSAFPYLSISKFYNGRGFGLRVKNSGTGLAFIKSYKIRTGDTYFQNWQEVVDHYAPEGHSINYGIMSTNGLQDEVITPNEEVVLFEVQWNEETRALSRNVDDLEIRVCYASLLEDYWVVNMDNGRTQLSGPCKPNPKQEFMN